MTAAVNAVPLESHILSLILSQPNKKNAISADMMVQLTKLLRQSEADEDVRVIVLCGEGDNFSSGGDLSQIPPGEASLERSRATLLPYLRAIETLRSITKPVIAMADGYVAGGAFSLLLACDLVCVSERIAVIPAFCKIGLAPEMGMAKFLPQLLGDKLAKEILFTNRVLNASDLQAFRLANRVCPPDSLLEQTMILARAIAEMPPLSIQTAKSMINAEYDTGLATMLTTEATASPFCASANLSSQSAAQLKN